MIVISNKFIPAFKKARKQKKSDGTMLATTEAGDIATYVTKPSGGRSLDSDFSDSDDDDDEGYDALAFHKPLASFTGAPWVPNFYDRLTMFIAGAPGAGKSYLAKQMINLLPTNIPILLFTALEENDGNFDDIGKERIFKMKMTPENLKGITLKGIRERVSAPQALLLFDDIDKIRDEKVKKQCLAIMNDALANGRGHEKHDGVGDIHVICTSHSANDYKPTKYAFENSNYIALFPGHTPPLQMYRMFVDKLGNDKRLCQRMMRLGQEQKIRSIIIHKTVPQYMIYGDKIMLL